MKKHMDSLGNRFWTEGGVLHRDDGPAIELADGRKLWMTGGALADADGRFDNPVDFMLFFYQASCLINQAWRTTFDMAMAGRDMSAVVSSQNAVIESMWTLEKLGFLPEA